MSCESRSFFISATRTLHRDPEVGPSLPRTAAYVTERLTALGYTPRPLAGGVVADITGEDTGRCVLLRADMDAAESRSFTKAAEQFYISPDRHHPADPSAGGGAGLSPL